MSVTAEQEIPLVEAEGLTTNEVRMLNTVRDLVVNAYTSRNQLMDKLFDNRRDIDTECGYPKVITSTMYRQMYEREGIAQVVVNLLPAETWAEDPEVVENPEGEDTAFETEVKNLVTKNFIWHYLHRADELSGIGEYGVLLLGIDDGKDLREPVDGVPLDGDLPKDLSELPNKFGSHKLLFLSPFDSTLAKVKTVNKDKSSPRYGKPEMYTLSFIEDGNAGEVEGQQVAIVDEDVHWTRVIHLVEKRTTSEIYGEPRMKPVWNRLYDIRKILGGSAEMFWRGAFPGFSFEVNPQLGAVEIDKESVRTQMDRYMNSLQRYIAVEGLNVKQLAPQVASPKEHFNIEVQAISMSLRIPYRKLVGSEQAKLAATEDSKSWNKQLVKRQTKYLDPMVIRPFIDRLIMIGILPPPSEEKGYEVVFPDLYSPSVESKVEVAKIWVEAMAGYIQSGIDVYIPPAEFLTLIMGMDPEVANDIVDKAMELIQDDDEEEDLMEDDTEDTTTTSMTTTTPEPPPGESDGSSEE
jgi:hypothetical protein